MIRATSASGWLPVASWFGEDLSQVRHLTGFGEIVTEGFE